MGKDAQEYLWYCCKCANFWSYSLYYICIHCHHNRGPCCTYQCVGKPGNRSAQAAQETLRPVPPPQPRKVSLPSIHRIHDADPRQKVNDRASPGSTTPSRHTASRVVAIGKHARSQTFFEVHGDEDGDCYTLVLQTLEAVMQEAGVKGKVGPGPPDFESSFPDEMKTMITAPQVQTSRPTKTAPTCSPLLQTKSIEQFGEKWPMGWRTRSSICSSPPACPTDGEADDGELQDATRRHIPSTGAWSVEIGPPPNVEEAPKRQSLLQNPGGPYRQAKPSGCVTLSHFQSLKKNDTAANSQARDVNLRHNDRYNYLDHTICPIPAGSLLSDGLDTAGQGFPGLLMQKLYRALWFHPNGCFRNHGRAQSGQNARPVASNGQNPTARNKRRLHDGRGGSPNGAGDDEQNSSRVKRSRVRPRKSDGPLREFACPVSKGNPDHGYEARCIGWSNSTVDHILRRHLLLHLDTRMQHLSKEKYDRVIELRDTGSYHISDQSQAEKLWIDAYMVIFEINEQDRRKVPSPYLNREDFPPNSHRTVFFSRTEGLIRQDPTLAAQIRAYVRELEFVDREIHRRRRHLREQYRVQEARLIEDNRNRLVAAEEQLDLESEEMHNRLNMRFGSVFAPVQEHWDDPSHNTLHDGVGTSAADTQSWSRVPEISAPEQGHLVPGGHASDHVSGDLGIFMPSMATLPSLETESGPYYGPFAGGNSYHPSFPPTVPSMTRYGNENEVVLPGRISPSSVIGESHGVEVSADVLPRFPDEALHFMPTPVGPTDVAEEGPEYHVWSSDPGHASSHTLCDSCDRAVFDGKHLCDSCARLLDMDPSSWGL